MKALTKIAALNLLLGPILYSYFFPGTNIHFDTIIFLIIGIVFTVNNIITKKHIRYPNYFKLYVLYASLIPIVGYIYYYQVSPWISSIITIILFSLVFIGSIPYLNLSLIKVYYKRIVYFICAIFILQEIMYAIVGYRFSAIIPFLDVAYSYTDTASFIYRQSTLSRGSSVFLEPAHFAQYVSGYIALCLAEKANEGSFKIMEPALLSFILLFTWSGNCILALLCLWGLFILKVRIKVYIKYIVIIPIAIAIGLYAFNYIAGTDKGANLLDRQKELNTEQSYVSSGMMRIYRGYFVYEDMPADLKITGVGTGYIPDAIDHTQYRWMFQSFERYVNNVQTLLIGNGIIGTLLFVLFLISLCRHKNRIPLFMVILFVAFCFVESFWCTSKMLLYLGLAVSALSQISKYKPNHAS